MQLTGKRQIISELFDYPITGREETIKETAGGILFWSQGGERDIRFQKTGKQIRHKQGVFTTKFSPMFLQENSHQYGYCIQTKFKSTNLCLELMHRRFLYPVTIYIGSTYCFLYKQHQFLTQTRSFAFHHFLS